MNRRVANLALVPLIVVLAVLAAGCGSKKAASTTTEAMTTTAAATTTAATTTSAGGSTTTSSGAGSSFAGAEHCKQLTSLGQTLSAAITSGGGNLQSEASALKAAADKAPSAIRDDIKTLADALATSANLLHQIGIKPGTVPTAAQLAKLQSAAASFGSPKLRQAETHLENWARQNCSGLGK